ncbi:MAG: malate permease [Clostridiales bacterium]|nr:malate permease [Clostridiales bacterium]
MDFMSTFNQILVLFMMLMIGFVVRKLNIVDHTFSKNLSNFLFNIVFPATIIHSMIYPFSIDVLIDSIWLIVISLGVIVFSVIVAMVTIRFLNTDELSRNVYEFGIIFSNFGFMGFPVVQALFGQEGIFYTSIFILPMRLLLNSLGIIIMSRGLGDRIKWNFKSFINPPVVSVLIGFFVFIFSIKFPQPIEMTISMVAATTAPLSMILAGILLATAKFSEMFSNYHVYIISFIRLFFLPVCVLIVLRLFDLDLLMIGVPVIITAMPMAANASILAEKYNGNAYLGAQCVFISTLISIITIPLIVFLVL